MQSTVSPVVSTEVEAAPDPLAFVFGGVAFVVHPEPDLCWEMGDEHRSCRAPFGVGPVAAHVDCVVSSAPELGRGGRAIRCDWRGDEASVETGGVRVELRRLAAGRYAATAMVRPDASGCSSLITALAGVVQAREGGVVLHASGVEIDGGVVLFIGPSGAGKTTAAHHCPDARWFARDRAVVFPGPGGWYAGVMCGGDPIALEPSAHRVLPLLGILRVRRGRTDATIDPCDDLRGLVNLRESLQSPAQDAESERRAMDRLLRLHGEARVGELRSVLGGDLIPLIRDWIEA